MGGLLVFLSKYMIAIINIMGLVLLGLLVADYIRLYNHKCQILEAVDRKNTNSYYNKKTGEIVDRAEKEAVTPDTIREYEKKFNSECSRYASLAGVIPVFPLFGILGTVAGLISQMKATGLEAVTQSLDVALSSTFWGLVWTIIFRLLTSFLSQRTIEDTRVVLEDYDKKFNNSYMQGNIVEDR